MPALCATVAQRPPMRWRSRARVRRSRRARAPRVPSGARVRVIPPRDSLGFSLHIVMQLAPVGVPRWVMEPEPGTL